MHENRDLQGFGHLRSRSHSRSGRRRAEVSLRARSRLLVWALLLLFVASGCQSTPKPTAELSPVALDGGKLRVVATTNIVADVVKNVGNDKIELHALMGVGVDPHTYVPSPADMALIHDAHVVFASGAGLEAGLVKTLEGAEGGAATIYLSKGLDLRPAPEAHEPAEGEAHKHEEEYDPHVWFSVPNVIRWAEAIAETLGKLDPANASSYQANAKSYIRELEMLDEWIKEQVATVPAERRKLVTGHPSFGYFAARYGFEQLGAVHPISPSSEPSAKDIARLEEEIRKFDVPAVFTESTVNPRLAEQVAKDTGVKLVSLYTGSLGGPGSGVESYISLMRYNVTAIVEALR